MLFITKSLAFLFKLIAVRSCIIDALNDNSCWVSLSWWLLDHNIDKYPSQSQGFDWGYNSKGGCNRSSPPPIISFSTDSVSQIKPNWKKYRNMVIEQSNSLVASLVSEIETREVMSLSQGRNVIHIVGEKWWCVHHKQGWCPSMVKSWALGRVLGGWKLQEWKMS